MPCLFVRGLSEGKKRLHPCMRGGRSRACVWRGERGRNRVTTRFCNLPAGRSCCHTQMSSRTPDSEWQQLHGRCGGGALIRARSPCSVISLPPPRWEGAAVSPRAGGISPSNPPLIPRPGLGLEMAGAEPRSSGTPARRVRLPLASPVLPRECDPGGLAPPAEGWALRAPGTPSPARLREAVPTQVRPWGGRGRRDAVCQLSRIPHVLSGCSPFPLVSA